MPSRRRSNRRCRRRRGPDPFAPATARSPTAARRSPPRGSPRCPGRASARRPRPGRSPPARRSRPSADATGARTRSTPARPRPRAPRRCLAAYPAFPTSASCWPGSWWPQRLRAARGRSHGHETTLGGRRSREAFQISMPADPGVAASGHRPCLSRTSCPWVRARHAPAGPAGPARPHWPSWCGLPVTASATKAGALIAPQEWGASSAKPAATREAASRKCQTLIRSCRSSP